MATRAKRYPTKSAFMHVRIQPTTKAALEKAAAASGRTVSAEAEHQLHRALSDMSTGPTYALMTMIGRTIDGVVGLKTARARWWNDPRQFDEAARMAMAAFELLRPPGPPPPESAEPLGERSGQFAVEATLREIQTVDTSVPFGKQTPHQRWLTLLKQDLGPLADRAFVFGASAEEARGRLALVKPILEELRALSRKSAKAPQSMTQAEAQRLAELQRKLLEAVKATGGENK
jgi:hypothetical protein